MKIKTMDKSYEEVMALPRPAPLKPVKPSRLLASVVRAFSTLDLKATHFEATRERMEAAGDGPWLVLMNHSSFIDLEIASALLYPKPYHIICTSDGFVGKAGVMQRLGCIPTQKFVRDLGLIGDMLTALHTLGSSVLMYPEASYTFDGKATPLPRKLGILLKKLNVPVVYIQTYGAFARDPLYNGLRKRQVDVKATMRCLLTVEEIKAHSVAELDAILDEAFSFDNFTWQKENGVEINEPFRAIGLERILFQCAACGQEGTMRSHDTVVECAHCGKKYTLTPLGELKAETGETEFPHIPDWYDWERANVRKSLEDGSYRLDTDVDIRMMVDYKAIYNVGRGHLTHDEKGFVLDGCEGKLHYEQDPLACYSLYSDYFWYELGDMICIGNADALYYCFPKKEGVVAKTRLAAEELYKMKREKRRER